MQCPAQGKDPVLGSYCYDNCHLIDTMFFARCKLAGTEHPLDSWRNLVDWLERVGQVQVSFGSHGHLHCL